VLGHLQRHCARRTQVEELAETLHGICRYNKHGRFGGLSL